MSTVAEEEEKKVVDNSIDTTTDSDTASVTPTYIPMNQDGGVDDSPLVGNEGSDNNNDGGVAGNNEQNEDVDMATDTLPTATPSTDASTINTMDSSTTKSPPIRSKPNTSIKKKKEGEKEGGIFKKVLAR